MTKVEVQSITWSEDTVINNIVNPCRAGKFIYVICNSKKKYILLKATLKDYLSFKRGLFTYKGIVAFTTNDRKEFYNNFDLVIKFEEHNGRPKKRIGTKQPIIV